MTSNSSLPEEKLLQANSGFANLARLALIHKTENSIEIEFSVSGENSYFDGHFPEFSLLPAVAQIELIIRFASKYLETGIDIGEIRRVKFINFIRPNTLIRLHLERGGNILSFRITDPGSQSVYSTGALTIPPSARGNS